jgi:hypothetical protein
MMVRRYVKGKIERVEVPDRKRAKRVVFEPLGWIDSHPIATKISEAYDWIARQWPTEKVELVPVAPKAETDALIVYLDKIFGVSL